MINKLVVFGVGLIGGSLALALKKQNYCQHVVGFDRNRNELCKAVDLGVIDSFTLDIHEAMSNADIVILSVPMGAMYNILSLIKPMLEEKTILTDVGSTKGSVVNDVIKVFGADFSRFVPGHPIAGREKSGVSAALADLYKTRRVILTPTASTSSSAIEAIENMWLETGAIVEHLSVKIHDEVLAATSHLPHILAFAVIDTFLKRSNENAIFKYAAGGFSDFTRIASSSPQMWHDIFLANRNEILAIIADYRSSLDEFEKYLMDRDSDHMLKYIERAKERRDKFIFMRNSL